jgi:hypothetical protein
MNIDTLMEKIVCNELLHSKWLNTLSYLEYVGARKIFKSQPEDRIDLSILEHMYEEIRHSLTLKQMIKKWCHRTSMKFSSDDMLAKSSAKKYFQSIDANSATVSDAPHTAYLFTSVVIETRALSLYRSYEKVLLKHKFGKLSGLIADEEKHLREKKYALEKMDDRCSHSLFKLQQKETELFSRFIADVEDEVDRHDEIVD